MKEQCSNCDGSGEVPCCIPCPECRGGGVNELLALRALANWVRRDFSARGRPPALGLTYLNNVEMAQGKPLTLSDEGW